MDAAECTHSREESASKGRGILHFAAGFSAAAGAQHNEHASSKHRVSRWFGNWQSFGVDRQLRIPDVDLSTAIYLV